MKALRIAAVTCSLLAVAVVAHAQSADATGKWELSLTTPSGPMSATLVLKKDGEKLTGTITAPQGETAVEGTQKDANVEIGFTMQSQNGPLDIGISGTQDGDSMKGTLNAGPRGILEWTATRAAAAGTPPQEKSDAVNVTGTWLFDVSSQMGTGTRTVTFKQEGEKVTGTYSGQYGESPLSGTVKGPDITFSFTIMAEGTAVDIRYTGKIDKDTIKGTFSMGELGDGTFSAKRKQ